MQRLIRVYVNCTSGIYDYWSGDEVLPSSPFQYTVYLKVPASWFAGEPQAGATRTVPAKAKPGELAPADEKILAVVSRLHSERHKPVETSLMEQLAVITMNDIEYVLLDAAEEQSRSEGRECLVVGEDGSYQAETGE
jgi:hypothetical protein